MHQNSIIYNKPTRCKPGSIVFINNYKNTPHVSDAKGVRNMWSILVVVNKHNAAKSCILLAYYILYHSVVFVLRGGSMWFARCLLSTCLDTSVASLLLSFLYWFCERSCLNSTRVECSWEMLCDVRWRAIFFLGRFSISRPYWRWYI